MSRKAIYPGSFNPFTNGHLDMVRKGAELFDEVVVIIGANSEKTRGFAADTMKSAIEQVFRDEGLANCSVVILDGLVAEYAHEIGARYMIRGLRNNLDYYYEENIAEINKLINPDLEYVYFRAEKAAISSSMVRELLAYGHDVSAYLPKAVVDCL